LNNGDTPYAWFVPLSEGNQQHACSLALAPDGQRVVIGMDNGAVEIWRIGGDSPEATFTDGTNCVESIAISPDGNFLLTCEVPRGVNRGRAGPLILKMRNWRSGEIVATITERDQPVALLNTYMAFHPTLKVVGLSINGSRFELRDIDTLQLLYEVNSISGESGAKSPFFFLSQKECPVEVLALGKVFQMADGSVTLIRDYGNQPREITPELHGIYVQLKIYDESLVRWLGEIAVETDPGLIIAPLDRRTVSQFLRFDRMEIPNEVIYLGSPDGTIDAAKIVTASRTSVFLLDIKRCKYQRLQHDMSKDTWGVVASPSRNKAAACGTWGVVVWDMRSN
jgi:hypothetical protein